MFGFFSVFSGIYHTDTHGLSASEGRSYVITVNSKPKEKRWASRLKSGVPGRAIDIRGHYRDQHQPQESDPDLLMEERHNNSTQIVVGLQTMSKTWNLNPKFKTKVLESVQVRP